MNKVTWYIIGPFSLLVSLVAILGLLLFWRVNAEPGYALQSRDSIMLAISLFLFICGVAGIFISSVKLSRSGKNHFTTILLIYGAMLIVLLPVMFLVLLIMLA